MTKKITKIIAGAVFAWALIIGAAPFVSAFTPEETQTQIRELVAKIAALQTEIKRLSAGQTPPPTAVVTVTPTDRPLPRICMIPAMKPVALGTRGDSVKALQEFLHEEGKLTVEPTGYFGPLTQKAVQNFQSENGIVASQNISAGWGTAGPRTNEFIRKRCVDRLPPPVPPEDVACAKEYKPTCGRPTGCENTCPPGMMCALMCKQPEPRTYGNPCMLKAANAEFLYEGACKPPENGNPPPVACTMEYNPVCGQKTVCPACANATPACLAPCTLEQKTYSNRCHMNADGATLVREGACSTTAATY